jgi:hypothetical protein
MSKGNKSSESVARRKAALEKKTAKDSKATPDNVRMTRKQLKRAQRNLARAARKNPQPGQGAAGAAPAADGNSESGK